MRLIAGARTWCVILAMLLVCCIGAATETEYWTIDTAEQMLDGLGQGVGVTSDGRLIPVARWSRALALEEPIAIAAARDQRGGLVIGTGHPARVWRLDQAGAEAERLVDLDEEQITSVLPLDDGSILIAAVTPGVLYRLRDGELTEVGRLGQGGVWDLLEVNGMVVAAAGPPAALYRVTTNGLERWVELPDAHARCLAAHDGLVVVGTSGKGLLAQVNQGGRVSLLADSRFTEIADLAVDGDGAIWAVALVGEPAQLSSSSGAETSSGSGGASGQASTSTQTTSLNLDLPKVNGSSATSEVFRLTPEGAVLKVHRFAKQVASTVIWDGEAILVGTGFEGEVWRFTAEGGARLTNVDAVQVVAAGDRGEYIVTQGPAQVLRRDGSINAASTFRSSAKSFKRPVRLGRFRIDPPQPGVKVRFRSGLTAKPDPTWTPWSEWLDGSEIQVPLGPVRVAQWELELPGQTQRSGSSAAAVNGVVERVVVAYQEVNLPPRIETLEVSEPGVVYLDSTPPSGPVIDVSHPDVSGIFSVIDPDSSEAATSASGKKYYRVGYRTVSWKAEDPNGDAIRFDIDLESRDGFVLPIRKAIKATQLALDVTAVPDGLYRFRLGAADHRQNPTGGLSTTALSEWFTVDSTSPEVKLQRQGSFWVVTAVDQGSAVARAEWSRDGASWHDLAPEDGLLDGPEERFRLEARDGRHLVSVRVIDRHHNRATVGVRED